MSKRSGYEIANSVDPNTSNDVCTFCKHAEGPVDLENGVKCSLGYAGYFRSISNLGYIFVSDCGHGELKPEWAALECPTHPAQNTETK